MHIIAAAPTSVIILGTSVLCDIKVIKSGNHSTNSQCEINLYE